MHAWYPSSVLAGGGPNTSDRRPLFICKALSRAPVGYRFGSADGVVARAVSRLVTIASGLDPHGLGVPEVSWMRQPAAYRDAAHGFAAGAPDGVGAWLVLCCRAMQAGAQEALSIAESLADR